MESTTVSEIYCTTPLAETQEAKKDDWSDRFFMTEPEHDPVPVYVCGRLIVTLWEDDCALEARA